jgi:hypothetical protein
MKTRRIFPVVLTTIFAIGAMSAIAWGAAPTPQEPKPVVCSMAGTWTGWVDRDWSDQTKPPSLAWTAMRTVNSSGKGGDMVLNWVPTVNDLFFGQRAHLTPGYGAWQQNGSQYNFTWYAYLVDDEPNDTATVGTTIYSFRVHGVVTFPTDCNHASITYSFDGIAGMVSPEKMSGAVPVHVGSGGETRMPAPTP